MASAELENLARIGKLKPEPPSSREYEGLIRSADCRLADAANSDLSLESRFDLAYGASHALALAALRRAGYRSENRALVLQTLPHVGRAEPGLASPREGARETESLGVRGLVPDG